MLVREKAMEMIEENTFLQYPYQCLFLDCSGVVHNTWSESLQENGWLIKVATNLSDAIDSLKNQIFDVVIIDAETDPCRAKSDMEAIIERYPELSCVIYSNKITNDQVVDFFRSGAKDFFQQNEATTSVTKLGLIAGRSRQKSFQVLSFESLSKQLLQLQFQNQVISSVQEIKGDSNVSYEEFIEQICGQVLSILKLAGLRIRLSGIKLQKEFGSAMELPWKGMIPEREVEQKKKVVFYSLAELQEKYSDLGIRNVSFFGFPLFDAHGNYLGVISYYIKQDKLIESSEDLFALVTKKVALIVASKTAEEDNQQSYSALLDLATFNMEMLADFRSNTSQELEHYRRTLDQIMSKAPNDLRPQQALIIREDKQGNVRVAPFHRNSHGRVVVMAPTMTLPSILTLFPYKKGGVSVNVASTNAFQTGTYAPFPTEIINLIGKISNYVYCPIQFVQGEVDTLVLFNYGRRVSPKDAAILVAFSVPLSFQVSFSRETRNRHQTQLLTMAKLAELAEKRDDETGAHLKRIAHYSRVLAEDLAAGYSPYSEDIDANFIRTMYESSPLHDIGKVGIEDAVLCKPGKLTDEEYDIMKTHTLIGAQVLEGVPFLRMAHDIALCHHEKFDGSGYPNKLSGKEIPLSARIVALADVYDAITSQRVYRPKPFTHDEAKALILREYGRHFDPAVVDAFLRCEQLFVQIREKYNPIDMSLIEKSET